MSDEAENEPQDGHEHPAAALAAADADPPPPDVAGAGESRDAATSEPQLEALMSEPDAAASPSSAAASDSANAATGTDGPGVRRISPPPARPAPSARRDVALKVVLLINLALFGAVLAMPGSERSEPQPATHGNEPQLRDPFTLDPARRLELPTSEHWEKALELAAGGDFGTAIRVLERYLEVEPHMPDAMKRQVYSQLSYYALKDGRMELADDYWRKSHQLVRRSYLPEDLLRSAERAAAAGDAAQMRAAYARFLLQQKMVPASMRHKIHEAYLRLGDSYREQAERGAIQAEQDAAQRARELRGARGAGR